MDRGPGPNAVHLCIDMQNLFAEGAPWATPWLSRTLPVVRRIAERHVARTVFTRFIPPAHPAERPGAWRRYFEKWRGVTRGALAPDLLDLVPALASLVPPARVLDKPFYSAFAATGLAGFLTEKAVDTVVITGAETDLCVLSTVFSAIDHGFRVFLVTDAVCSSTDATHDAVLALYATRLSEQLVALTADELLERWPAD